MKNLFNPWYNHLKMNWILAYLIVEFAIITDKLFTEYHSVLVGGTEFSRIFL